jgi:hypothetical protein
MPEAIPYKKVLILPPLKGLNLHDNPLQMSPEFATEMTNFMPPTSRLDVRPAIETVCTMVGSARAVLSFNVGARYAYKEHWYQKTLSFPAYSKLLLFVIGDANICALYNINPDAGSYNIEEYAETINYSDDFCFYKTSVFLMLGDQSGTPYVYSGRKGLHRMALKIGAQGQVPNLENICSYHDHVFMNVRDTLTIYFANADGIDPDKDQNWDKGQNFFSVTAQSKTIELATIVNRGGSIYKIFTLTAQTNNSVNMYLCVITTNGELVVYQGEDPNVTATWKLIGIFDIPTPLNKRCFSQMEGDMIIATRNGFVSLQRLIFKQKTDVTEAIEMRLSNLFTDYEFKVDTFKDQFFLKYYRNRRLLIFNVPVDMPLPFKDLMEGYIFDSRKSLVFAYAPTGYSDNTVPYMDLVGFIVNYIWKFHVDYRIIYELNGNSQQNRIEISFVTELLPGGTATHVPAMTAIEFFIVLNGVRTEIISPSVVETLNVIADTPVPVATPRPVWNPYLQKGTEIRFDFTGGQTYEVTNIVPMIYSPGNLFGTGDLSLLKIQNTDPMTNMQCSSINYVPLLDPGVFPEAFISAFMEDYVFNPEWEGRLDLPKNYACQIKNLAIAHANQLVTWGTTNVGGATSNLYYMGTSGGGNVGWFSSVIDFSYVVLDAGNIKIEIGIDFSFEHMDHPVWLYGCDVEFGIKKDQLGAWEYAPATLKFSTEDDNVMVPITLEPDTKNMFKVNNLSDVQPYVPIGTPQARWSLFFGSLAMDLFHGNYNPNFHLFEYRFSNVWRTLGWIHNLLKTPYDSVNIPTTSGNSVNYSFESVPLINNTQIRSPYTSTQYVFNSLYGTWSSWKDINMSNALEHRGEFYFVVDKPITSPEQRENRVTLCKFNEGYFGDDNIYPINVSYLSAHMDLKAPDVQKQFTNVKVYGTAPIFWDTNDESFEFTYPFTFQFYCDFKKQEDVTYLHRYMTVWNEKLKRTKPIKLYSFQELKDYQKLYASLADSIDSIDLPIVANPSTRIAIGMRMAVFEHSLIIYGYELIFKPLLP